MKAMLAISFLLCLTGLVAVMAPCVYAQAEIDPDHFESPNTEPFPPPKPNAESQVADTRYEGRFALPYFVLCSGNRLAPGKYIISLRSDGNVGQAILNLKGQTVRIAGVVHRQTHKRSNSALIVEHKGMIRTLSAIQMAEFDFIFDANQQVGTSSKSKTRRFERLGLTLLPLNRRHGTAG